MEGEGTIRINKPKIRNWGSLAVSVVNTDKQAVDWFQSRWPAYMKLATGRQEHCKPAWVWVTAARKAADFLLQIRPYVVRDHFLERLDHALEFQRQKRMDVGSLSGKDRYQYAEDQWNYYWWACELNQQGAGRS